MYHKSPLLNQVKYPSGVVADLGNKLTPRQVKDPPVVSWPAEEDKYYTLIMTGKQWASVYMLPVVNLLYSLSSVLCS